MSDYETREHDANVDRLSGPVPDAWEPPSVGADAVRAMAEKWAGAWELEAEQVLPAGLGQRSAVLRKCAAELRYAASTLTAGEPWNPNDGPHTRAQYGNDPAHCMECTAAIQQWVTYPCRGWLSENQPAPSPGDPS